MCCVRQPAIVIFCLSVYFGSDQERWILAGSKLEAARASYLLGAVQSARDRYILASGVQSASQRAGACASQLNFACTCCALAGERVRRARARS